MANISLKAALQVTREAEASAMTKLNAAVEAFNAALTEINESLSDFGSDQPSEVKNLTTRYAQSISYLTTVDLINLATRFKPAEPEVQ